MTYTFAGDTQVRLLIPSRRQDGGVVDPELRREWTGKARTQLDRLFGGATALDTDGSFTHDDGRVTRELITILTSVAPEESLNTDCFLELKGFAENLCGALGQECIFFSWGERSYLAFSRDDFRKVRTVRFTELSEDSRTHNLVLGWGGINTPSRIFQLLSLDGWSAPPKEERALFGDARLCCRLDEGEAQIRVWAWEGELGAFKKALPELRAEEGGARPGDLVFVPGRQRETLQVLRLEAKSWSGPRDLAISHGRLNPVTRELLLAILDRKWAHLSALLRQKPLTADFYPRLRKVQKAIEVSFRTQGRKDAFKLSILVVGRVMFLRFLAQKGWLPGGVEHLVSTFGSRKGSYFKTVLQPLCFDLLNEPPASRSKSIEKLFPGSVPYLNGGLFAPRAGERKLDLPDEVFDPGAETGFLRLLQDYEFSLNEWAGSDESPKIDPALLGRILESFNNEHEIKKGGIHYTPKPIGAALAFEGIISRLATLSGLDRGRIQGFVAGRRDELNGREAERLQRALKDLRIIDPAVGSGALLWACLEAMIVIDDACEAALGGFIVRGSLKWATRCRHFVANCLFGVDISEEAVELTRLRLWLTVAMSEAEATPLPDLALNIIRGDSLLLHESRPGVSRSSQRRLEFSGRVQLEEEYEEALHRYRDAAGEPETQRTLREKVASIRRQLSDAGGVRDSEEAPLVWELSFADVLGGKRQGFDLVIANPPYVRIQKIAEASKEKYRQQWRQTMGQGNADLSFGFVELALSRLAAPDGGQIAFILPSFGQNDSAAGLRRFLSGGGEGCPARIDLWVDFEDQQVFPSAQNYPALLFASRCRAGDTGKAFAYTLAPPKVEWQTASDNGWLRSSTEMQSHEPKERWQFIPRELRSRLEEISRRAKRRLDDLCDVGVGVQTSKDDVFLFDEVQTLDAGLVRVRTAAGRWAELEAGLVRRCIKGASRDERWILFPYDSSGKLLGPRDFEEGFPKAWAYLSRHRAALGKRKGGSFTGDRWFQFGRQQGFAACLRPKILVPATLNEMRCIVDAKGELAFTASGKGGGGAWALLPRPDGPNLETLAAILGRQATWDQILATGSRQQGGWRGVDQELLAGILVE